MAFAGIGAGINELTALAVASELAPTRKRGIYVSALIFTILPFCPSVLWAQLIASRHGWRYCGALCGAWAAFGLLMTLMFYFPPPRINSKGFSRMQIIRQIDFVGGFLSISGMLLLMAGLQWGGYQVCERPQIVLPARVERLFPGLGTEDKNVKRMDRCSVIGAQFLQRQVGYEVSLKLTLSEYPWRSAHVLAPLLIGTALLAAFFVWEWVSDSPLPCTSRLPTLHADDQDRSSPNTQCSLPVSSKIRESSS